LLSPTSDCAEDSTCDEAAPVSAAPRLTSVMLAATWLVPAAACWTLRVISWVAAPCPSTADAMVVAMSEIRPMVPPISLLQIEYISTPAILRRRGPRRAGALTRRSMRRRAGRNTIRDFVASGGDLIRSAAGGRRQY
jgi:hypothetical protein